MTRTRCALVVALLLPLTFSPALLAADDLEVTQDVVYGHKVGMALSFDVFQPADANGAGVLFMVSGGWFSSWRPPEQAQLFFKPLLDSGFTVFAIRHGSAPLFKVPDAVDDVRLAARYVRAHAEDYGVDPERLGAWGASAGGHLSLMLGTTGDDGADVADGAQSADDGDLASTSSRVAAVVAYFPPVDLAGMTGPNDRFPALDFPAEEAEAVSPILHVSADDAPSLMIHGDEDTLVPVRHSKRMTAALAENNVGTELIVIEGAGHGFRGEDGERAAKAMVEWFGRYLAPASVSTSAN